MKITEIDEFHPGLSESIYRLLLQLTEKQLDFSDDMLRLVIESPNSHLLVATDDDELVGMLTIATYITPIGKKAWIEDVVVDEIHRGKGFAKELISYAIDWARRHDIPILMLTSNPKRVAANQLYPKMLFQRRETNVYRMELTEEKE